MNRILSFLFVFFFWCQRCKRTAQHIWITNIHPTEKLPHKCLIQYRVDVFLLRLKRRFIAAGLFLYALLHYLSTFQSRNHQTCTENCYRVKLVCFFHFLLSDVFVVNTNTTVFLILSVFHGGRSNSFTEIQYWSHTVFHSEPFQNIQIPST